MWGIFGLPSAVISPPSVTPINNSTSDLLRGLWSFRTEGLGFKAFGSEPVPISLWLEGGSMASEWLARERWLLLSKLSPPLAPGRVAGSVFPSLLYVSASEQSHLWSPTEHRDVDSLFLPEETVTPLSSPSPSPRPPYSPLLRLEMTSPPHCD